MLDVMTSARPDEGSPARRGPLVAEIAALVLLAAVDSVMILRSSPARGLAAGLVTAVVPGLGPAAAILAVLRRRFVARIGLLGGGVVAISALNTALSALTHGHQAMPRIDGLTPDQAVTAAAALVGVDRDPGRRQGQHVAVDRPLGDLQLTRQLARGHHPA